MFALCAAVTASCATAKRHAHTPAHIPAHIDTWAFDDGCNGGTGASPALVRGWVTYAESHCGPAATKALRDCHAGGRRFCKVMQYLDAQWLFPADAVQLGANVNDNWWLHPPGSADPVHDPTLGGGNLLNQANPAVRAFFHAYVQANYDTSDGLLMDWQSPSLAQELYYATCGCTQTREITSDRALRAAHAEMAAALTHRNGSPFLQADNTMPSNPYQPQGFDMLNHRIGVDGWVTEGMPMSDGAFDSNYATLLDQMAYMDNRTHGFFVLLSRSPAGAPYQGQTRQVQEATVLLGYAAARIVDWADLEEGSGDLAVWPEEGIVPSDPVQTMTGPNGRGCMAGAGVMCSRGGHTSLQVAPGVYRRIFRSCYRRRAGFGPCGAIVNTTGHPVVVRRRWLRGVPLSHEITFAGGDVQSGGAIDVAGAPFVAGVTTVAPDNALLLAR